MLALGAVACEADRSATGPGGHLPGPPVFEAITQPTVSLTLTPTSSYQNLPRDSVVYYPKYTMVTVHATGLLQEYYSDAAGWDTLRGRSIGSWDAAGGYSQAYGCNGNVYVGFADPGFVGFCRGAGDTVKHDTYTAQLIVKGTGTVGWDRGPVTDLAFCDKPGLPPCFVFTGSHTVSITPEPVNFDVTANPTTANYKDTVTVTATVSPGQVGTLNVPWTIDSVKWAPAFGTQTSPCQWSDFVTSNPGTRTCRKPFTRTGTLTVFATVNGVAAQKALTITVTPPQLNVTAAPASVTPSQNVTFTASVTPSTITWNLSTWTWRPDSGTGGISAPCNWWEKTCSRGMSKSGWMRATAIIGEYTLNDSAHVSVVPCLTNDSILDDSRIRRKLSQAWNNSNSNATASQRLEQWGMRVRLPDGRIVDSNFTNLPGATPCKAFDEQLFNPNSIGTVLLTWHTHPFKPATKGFSAWIPAPPGELLPIGPAGCPTGQNGGAFPGPSDADKNHPYQQIIVDKTNAYWIDHPPTNFNQLANLVYQTKRRNKCDILTYN